MMHQSTRSFYSGAGGSAVRGGGGGGGGPASVMDQSNPSYYGAGGGMADQSNRMFDQSSRSYMGGGSSVAQSTAPSLSRAESISNFLYDLNAAIAPKKIRLEAIAFSLEFFNHEDQEAHDEELALGAANVLLSKLAYAFSVHPLDDEVFHVATSLNMILGGASRDAVSKAFDEAGKSVIPLMVDMIRPPYGTTCHPLAVNRMIAILRYFSRVLTAMVPMAHYPGLLEALMFHIQRPTTPNPVVRDFTLSSGGGGAGTLVDGDDYPMDIQRRTDAMATLVNLACAEENKYLMANHTELLKQILVVGKNDPIPSCREHSATILMNLAYHEPNQKILGKDDDVLDTLVVLMRAPQISTRRYASAALFTLACVHQNATVMTSHRGGTLLESLRVALLQDESEESRINAAEALWHFAKNGHTLEQQLHKDDMPSLTDHGKTTPVGKTSPIEHMANHPGLLESLSTAVTRDSNPEVRSFASRALEWMAASITFPAESHRALLTALVVSSDWTGSSSISQGFYNQAIKEPNRLPMVQHVGLLDALANLALLQALELQYVRAPAVAAIEQLSQEPRARSALNKHEGIMMALTKATFNSPEEEELAGSAIVVATGASEQGSSLGSSLTTAQSMRSALKNLTNAS